MDRYRLKEVLEQDEGRKSKKYKDTENKWTIGIGHLMSRAIAPDAYELATGDTVDNPTVLPSDVGEISDAAIDAIYYDDVQVAIDDAVDWLVGDTGSSSRWHALGHVRQEIVANMSFNLGRRSDPDDGGLDSFVKFRAALLDEDWEEAADEMVDSDWYDQVGNRSVRLVAAMRSNDPDDLYDS